MENNIESLDSNFKVSPGGSSLAWYDAQNFFVAGKGWEIDRPHYRRLPARAESLVTPEVWRLSQYSSGLAIYFATNSTSLSIHWKNKSVLKTVALSATGANGLDLYIKDGESWRFAAVCPFSELENNVEVMAFLGDENKEYCLHLPLFAEPEFVRIGVDEKSQIAKCKPFDGKPILFYGTSIVHGSAASRPSMTYPAQISRALKRPFFNFGFSGNGKMEIEVAKLLAELDPSLYVLDPLPNMDAKAVEERAYPFIKHIISCRPNTPIMLVSCVPYTNYKYRQFNRCRYDETNPLFRAVFERLQAEGNSQVFFFNAENALGHDFEGAHDGTHPTDLGFFRFAQALAPAINAALTKVAN